MRAGRDTCWYAVLETNGHRRQHKHAVSGRIRPHRHGLSHRHDDSGRDALIDLDDTTGITLTIVAPATGDPIADVIVRTGVLGAVSDARGKFVFRGLPSGTHYLTVDARSLGDRVVDAPLPITVEVSGQNPTLTIPVAAASRVST